MAKGFSAGQYEGSAGSGADAPDFCVRYRRRLCGSPPLRPGYIISRVLENAGYRVAMLPQPDWHSCEPFKAFGRPKIGFGHGGVIDSMVNHYTAAKKKRSEDAYAPGGKAGRRPDRATIVYCNRIREAYGDIPIAIGGWTAARTLMFGMGERSVLRVAEWMASGRDFSQMRVPGTCVMAGEVPEGFIEIPAWEVVAKDRRAYAEAFRVQYDQ